MEQKCDVTKPDCHPGPAEEGTQPEILLGPDVICPDYYNKTACCNNGQNILLKNNFDALDSIFGSNYGGCDICAINLKRFWCHFTCSTDQDKFSKFLDNFSEYLWLSGFRNWRQKLYTLNDKHDSKQKDELRSFQFL